jgi:alpha-1,3-rhamnosyltransferase
MLSKESINLSETVPGLVSVLIPAYNHEQYIQQTIHSIIDQTYQNIELIVIDDGSTDSTWEKINELKSECEKRFTRVVFQTQENAGTSTTINRLIKQSCGEYTLIIASDDVAFPDMIQTEYNFLSSNPDYGLAVPDNIFIDEHGQECFVDEFFNIVEKESSNAFRLYSKYLKYIGKFADFNTKNLYRQLFLGHFFPNGYLIRSNCLKSIGELSSETPLEDYYIRVQLSKICKMKFIDEPHFYYRRHGGNVNFNTIRKLAIKTIWHERRCLCAENGWFGNLIWSYNMIFYVMNFLVFNIKRKYRNL